MTSFRVEVWGVRGSIPTPGEHTVRYGGNTPCVTVDVSETEGPLIVLDAGTGIRRLGNQLLAERSADIDLLISHTHWDHIQGLPFFLPLFEAESRVRVWGAKQGDVDLESVLRRQMDPVVFPVPLEALDAELAVSHLSNGELELQQCNVKAMRVRHPGHTLAVRLYAREGTGSIAYVPDNELGSGGDYEVGPNWRSEFVKFLEGASLLIHDAMYTPEMIDRHRGYGHSTFAEAVVLAVEAKVEKLMLFHHSPDHGDEAVDEILERARGIAGETGSDLDIIAGSEGMVLDI
ncbi:MAG: MBL fold metallo-hydrolase [Gemmatimonadales bacterium]